MFQVKSIDHVVLRVDDVESCLRFYTDVIGCTVEKEHPDIGLYQLRAGEAIVDLVDVAGVVGRDGGAGPSTEGRNLDHFCVRVEPFDETELRAHFASHGIEASPLLNNWGGDGRGPSMYVKDPSGNGVEVKGPPTIPYDPAVGFVPDG